MSDKVNFTLAQRQVLDTMDKNLLVSASAGTGKTTVMVERIKKLVQERHAQIDRMLIVTYTKLAASEMKEKLYKVLSECDDSFVQEQVALIDTCSIGTIHSFCADVIREYFYVVGIDPNFSVLKREETAQLFDRAMDSVFERRYRESTELFDVVEKFCGERDDGTLRENVRRLHAFNGGIENLSEWYEDSLKKYDRQYLQRYFNERLIEQTAMVKDNLYLLCQELGGVGADKLVDRIEGIREQLVATDKCSLEQNLTYLGEVKIPARSKSLRSQVFFNCDFDEEERLWNLAIQAENDVKQLLAFAGGLLPAVEYPQIESSVEDFCRFNVGLAQEVEDAFSAIKREKNVVDFSDMEKMTLTVLRDAISAEQIRNRFDYVFVDEYQDVNGIQEQIIQLVVQPKSLFAVGDVKQSIYGFRQADPDIFVEKEEKYLVDGQDSKVVYMNDNFRCCRDVVDFVNLTFGEAMTKEFGKVDYEKTGKLIVGKDSAVQDGARGVEIVYISNEKKSQNNEESKETTLYDVKVNAKEKISDGKAEGAYIATKIKELVGKQREDGTTIGYGDIVVLRRSVKGDAIDLYKQLLQEGIPTVIKLENEDFYKEINDLRAFFKVVDNRYDDYSLATALVSPLGKMDFDDLATLASGGEKNYLWQRLYGYAQNSGDLAKNCLTQKCRDFIGLIEKYTEISAVLKTGKLLLQLFEETQYEKYVLTLPNGNLRRERLLAFCSQVNDLTLQEFLAKPSNAEDFAFSNIVGDAVRIMTIHVSKGLEFDVVFLSGLDSAFSHSDKGNLLINKQRGMGAKMNEEGNYCVSLREKFVESFNLIKQREEELRLLYVGATRAKRKLICSVVGDKKPKLYFYQPSMANKMQEWLPSDSSVEFFEEKIVASQELLIKKDEERNDDSSTSEIKISQALLDYYQQAINWQYPHNDWSALPLKVVSSKLDSDRYFKQNFEEEEEQAVFLTTEQEGAEEYSQQLVTPSANQKTGISKTVDSGFSFNSSEDTDKTELGKAYHKIFEICDITFPTMEKLQGSLAQAVEEGWITSSTAQNVDLTLIKKVLDSREFKEMLEGGKVYREMPFLTTLPYDSLFGEGSDREIMLQGVIDMLVVKEDCAVVLDFKITGNSTKIKERYEKQLNSYALAVEKCLKLPTRSFVLSVLDGKIVAF